MRPDCSCSLVGPQLATITCSKNMHRRLVCLFSLANDISERLAMIPAVSNVSSRTSTRRTMVSLDVRLFLPPHVSDVSLTKGPKVLQRCPTCAELLSIERVYKSQLNISEYYRHLSAPRRMPKHEVPHCMRASPL
jgi:hypothetical protein